MPGLGQLRSDAKVRFQAGRLKTIAHSANFGDVAPSGCIKTVAPTQVTMHQLVRLAALRKIARATSLLPSSRQLGPLEPEQERANAKENDECD